MEKPLLIYDGDCNFCKRWILRWKKMTGDEVDYLPSQEAAPRFPQIPAQDFAQAVQLIEPDGKVFSGARAVFKSLSYGRKPAITLWLYENFPPFATASEAFYGIVARHRVLFSKLTNLLWGRNLEPPTYVNSSWLFMRFLGIINLIAFLSLGSQVEGLIGTQGILPLDTFLRAVKAQYGPRAHDLLPTLFWFTSSDAAILGFCRAGAALSLLLALDLAPWFIPAALWALYLSLSLACREFLSFQWDILLLEINFLAIFLNPPRIFPRLLVRSGPSSAVAWTARLVLFKLMLQSGLVKLLSGDPAWRNLTALSYHYETQPLPNWVSWYVHHMPMGFHKFSAAGMFAVELLVPFLIFFPRRMKLIAFCALAGLQVMIMLTGNYGFFNWLVLALCLLLLDDQTLRLPQRLAQRLSDSDRTLLFRENLTLALEKLRKSVVYPCAAALIFLNLIQIAGTFYRRNYPSWMDRIMAPIYSYRTVNSYGLFAVMTTSRPEIIIEGSNDGKTWLPYEFKWKPGDLSKKPRFVAPHQPRVDWQMWFAALGNLRENPWCINFLGRLLEGSKPVLGLLDKNPFPDAPPKGVRAQVYDYHFTSRKEKRDTGKWWRASLLGPYCPPISLRERK